MGVQYEAALADKKITARLELGAPRDSPRVLVRFRHPDKAAISAVRVQGKPWSRFSGEDVDITGLGGSVVVEATY